MKPPHAVTIARTRLDDARAKLEQIDAALRRTRREADAATSRAAQADAALRRHVLERHLQAAGVDPATGSIQSLEALQREAELSRSLRDDLKERLQALEARRRDAQQGVPFHESRLNAARVQACADALPEALENYAKAAVELRDRLATVIALAGQRHDLTGHLSSAMHRFGIPAMGTLQPEGGSGVFADAHSLHADGSIRAAEVRIAKHLDGLEARAVPQPEPEKEIAP